MTNQDWDCVFVKVGHYVASKRTDYGEAIVLCSEYEKLPSPHVLEARHGEVRDAKKNKMHKSRMGLPINYSLV